VRAERAVSRALGGSCQLPLAAYASVTGATIELRGLVANPDGKSVVKAEVSGPSGAPEELGARLAGELRAQGADRILAALR
jgi:hydroxymethylbilane synthase